MKLLVFLSIIFIASCTPKYTNIYFLEKPKPNEDLVYSDSLIDATFDMDHKGISFVMKNKSQDKITIYWDECAMVLEGTSMRVTHKGVRYIECNTPH
jgi:hypothetical protein